LSLLTRPTVSLNTLQKPPPAMMVMNPQTPASVQIYSLLRARRQFIPARLGKVIRRPWLSTFRTQPATPAPRPHLDSQIRPTPSGRASGSLVRKTLVILDPIQNTLEMHPVPPCEIRVTLHYPLEDSDRMHKLILWPLPGSFAFSYPQILRKNPQGGVPL